MIYLGDTTLDSRAEGENAINSQAKGPNMEKTP